MGNTSTKEAGSPYDRHSHSRTASASSSRLRGTTTTTTTNDPARSSNPLLTATDASSSSRRNRDRSREGEARHQNLESALLTMGIMGPNTIDRHRDRSSARTKEEEREAREAKKAEREREKENARQKSLREESCDGGYLVTHGVYTAAQDYKDRVVRHLILERKLAPFFKGLPDHEDTWNDAQLVAAVRGLPIPGPDATYPPEPMVEADINPTDSNPHLLVPTGNRSRAHSDSSTRSGGIAIPSSSRARSKTLTSPKTPAHTTSTSNPLETKIEGNYVDGRPIEAILYKEAKECPICFLYYPPWTNRTRCCDYDICSECFVQIKRADPHLPEHEQDQNAETTTNPDLLISEPACCPFCKEPFFGVVYSHPPFRRGLVYTDSLAPSGTPETSQPCSPSLPSSPTPGGLRRKVVLASTAPEVVTTDQIRPDWAHKLASARNQAARRAAAATALHTAAFLMSNTRESGGASASGSGFPGRRLIRRSTNHNGSDSPSPQGSGSGAPRVGDRNAEGVSFTVPGIGLLGVGPGNRTTPGGATRTDDAGTRRRSRIVDLEEMMLREAIRLSILEEEQRKKKEEAEAAAKREEEPRSGTAGGGSSSDASGKGKTVDRSGSGLGVGEPSSSGGRTSTTNLSNSSGVLIAGLDELGGGAGSGPDLKDVTAAAQEDDLLHPSHVSRRGSAADVKAVEAGITVIGGVRRVV